MSAERPIGNGAGSVDKIVAHDIEGHAFSYI